MVPEVSCNPWPEANIPTFDSARSQRRGDFDLLGPIAYPLIGEAQQLSHFMVRRGGKEVVSLYTNSSQPAEKMRPVVYFPAHGKPVEGSLPRAWRKKLRFYAKEGQAVRGSSLDNLEALRSRGIGGAVKARRNTRNYALSSTFGSAGALLKLADRSEKHEHEVSFLVPGPDVTLLDVLDALEACQADFQIKTINMMVCRGRERGKTDAAEHRAPLSTFEDYV